MTKVQYACCWYAALVMLLCMRKYLDIYVWVCCQQNNTECFKHRYWYQSSSFLNIIILIIFIIALVGGGITCKVTRGCSEPHSTYSIQKWHLNVFQSNLIELQIKKAPGDNRYREADCYCNSFKCFEKQISCRAVTYRVSRFLYSSSRVISKFQTTMGNRQSINHTMKSIDISSVLPPSTDVGLDWSQCSKVLPSCLTDLM